MIVVRPLDTNSRSTTGEDCVAHRLRHVAHHWERLRRDLGAVDPGCVLGRDGLRAAGGQHHAGRVVDALAAHLASVVDRVDDGVLADQISCGSSCAAIWDRM